MYSAEDFCVFKQVLLIITPESEQSINSLQLDTDLFKIGLLDSMGFVIAISILEDRLKRSASRNYMMNAVLKTPGDILSAFYSL